MTARDLAALAVIVLLLVWMLVLHARVSRLLMETWWLSHDIDRLRRDAASIRAELAALRARPPKDGPYR